MKEEHQQVVAEAREQYEAEVTCPFPCAHIRCVRARAAGGPWQLGDALPWCSPGSWFTPAAAGGCLPSPSGCGSQIPSSYPVLALFSAPDVCGLI